MIVNRAHVFVTTSKSFLNNICCRRTVFSMFIMSDRAQLYTGVSHIPSPLQNLDTKPVRRDMFGYNWSNTCHLAMNSHTRTVLQICKRCASQFTYSQSTSCFVHTLCMGKYLKHRSDK